MSLEDFIHPVLCPNPNEYALYELLSIACDQLWKSLYSSVFSQCCIQCAKQFLKIKNIK